ncbi:hypothetical protein ABE29_13190 [Cytobacillus firmus]|nr:hypothetical protein [Cytobacillus firmus]MBG9546742.1 hypothetical protein [Cytobacillus firmus]MBG9553196.1 hypothetical protein [Cytobacillus firmus]MBG9556861.1 hypothetical protein [Cytobacillus firmus]MBG9574937.1 hypothetical protein [Cytobacillus firmus]
MARFVAFCILFTELIVAESEHPGAEINGSLIGENKNLYEKCLVFKGEFISKGEQYIIFE